jgi:D-sedoheptulose 7-phosphate isomerase
MSIIESYINNLSRQLQCFEWSLVEQFALELVALRKAHKTLYICGNGGSAGNAIHLANDFSYGINPGEKAIKVEALPANSAVLTCLGNDIGFENIYSHQLKTKGEKGDMLLVLSGSGNSPNIINALIQAKECEMSTYAILGFSGGKARELVDHPLHFEVDDMQISEDLQIIIGHMLMKQIKSILSSEMP